MNPSDPLQPLGICQSDLAPNDTRSQDFDWTGLGVHFVQSTTDANFRLGYDALWQEFGHKNEMETRDVIARRLAWRPEEPTASGYALRYEMIVVRHGDTLAAVRDHTAIVDLNRPDVPAIVHLSHLLIAEAWRGNGLAGWMRALPIYTARECMKRAGQSTRPINLIAEMEPAVANEPGVFGRLKAYERAGFKKIDPSRVNYLQPDFRPADEIDRTGGPTPLPLSLVLRRIGREDETNIPATKVRAIVESLYAMYAASFGDKHMTPLFAQLNTYPTGDEPIALVPPTLVPSPLEGEG
ncbi:MAG: hypothetical protein QM754_10195 [Tepidisphaeraceae bacterium]